MTEYPAAVASMAVSRICQSAGYQSSKLSAHTLLVELLGKCNLERVLVQIVFCFAYYYVVPCGADVELIAKASREGAEHAGASPHYV